MKKFLIITVLVLVSLPMLAQSFEEKMEKFGEDMEKFGEELEKKMESKASEGVVTIKIKDGEDSAKAYLGVFPDDLELEDVRRLGYDLNYGVILTGVVEDGPAFNQKLYKDDIIYEINGKKIIDDYDFTDYLKRFKAGETVEMKIFSNKEHKSIQFTFGQRPHKNIEVSIDKEKDKVEWNSIAINWIPRYYQLDDIDHVNGMLDQMGFQDLDEGMFTNGFGFRIHVGSGFYLGGEWNWYETDDKVNYLLTDTNENVLRKMDYENGFAGITLDKRIYFTKYFQPGIGFLLGGGSQTLKFSQTNGDYDWDNFNDDFNSSANNSMSMSRDYVIFQPRADLYIPILSWVGIRGEVSYVMGYSPESSWKGSDYGIINSPETKCDGLMFSVGPWIEF